MNIDIKLGKLSNEIRYRNDEDDIKHTLETTPSETSDRVVAEGIHVEELKAVKKISALEKLKQTEINRQADDERARSETAHSVRGFYR